MIDRANRQPHPYAAGFRGVERLENALEMFRINPRSSIAHCYEDAICLVLLCADRQLSWPLLESSPLLRRHSRSSSGRLVAIEHDPPERQTAPPRGGFYRDAILDDFALRQYNHLIDRLIEIKTILSRRSFLDVIPDPVDDAPARSASSTMQSSASLTSPRIRRLRSKKFMAARALLRAVAIGWAIS